MHIDRFKAIARQVSELEKTGVKFDVSIVHDEPWTKGYAGAGFEPVSFEVSTLRQLSDVQAILAKPLPLSTQNCKLDFSTLKGDCVRNVMDVLTTIKAHPLEKSKYPTLKFYSNIARNSFYINLEPKMICEDPPQQQEEDITYRFIGTRQMCQFCIPHTHPLYNYLDKGSFFTVAKGRNGKEKIFITNEMTVDTYLCLCMAVQDPDNMQKHLQNECYINANIAKVTRVKMEKDFVDNLYGRGDQYNRLRESVLREYEKTANAGLLDKLMKGTIPSGSFNQMKLTKNSAQYEDIKIEADNLLQTLLSNTVFDDRTDIYVLINAYISKMIDEVEEHKWTEAPPPPAGTNVEQKVMDDWAAKCKELAEQTAERAFVVNGINVSIKRTNQNTRRYVNGIPINKEEVEKVAFRASCFTDQETFDKFVTSVKNMSLKWHDAIALGVGVKIHDGMSYDEYKKAEAPMSAPKLTFRVINGDVHLKIDDNKSAKIKFNDALKKISTLNRKTNDSTSYSMGYRRRDAAWARTKLIDTLIECCTFEEKKLVTKLQKVKAKKGEADKFEEVPVLDADGKKTYEKVKKCTLTREDAQFIEKMARDYHLKALEKSKLFLETAIKNTGAKLEKFNGEDHYIVEGKLRKYAVNAKTNGVFNYETKGYICIVEPGHQVSVGGDATACRLYALKNDTVTLGQIGTLRHG